MHRLVKSLLCFTLLFSLLMVSSVTSAKSTETSKEEQKVNDLENQANGKYVSSFDSKLGKRTSNKSMLKQSVKVETQATDLYLESIDPEKFATNVPKNKIIKLSLNTDIIYGSGKISVWNTNTLDDFSVKTEIVGSELRIYPQGNLSPNQKYMVSLDTDAIRSADNNLYNEEFYYSFTTGNYVTPMIVSTNPVYGDLNTSNSGKITFTYDSSMKLANRSNILFIDENGKGIAFTASVTNKTLTVTSNEKLKTNTKYAVGVFAGALSDTKKVSNQDYVLAFKTGTSDGDNGGTTTPSTMNLTLIKGITNKLKLSGGSTPYTVTSSDKKIVTATLKSTSLEIKGISVGTATIVVKDKAGHEIDIKVDVITDTVKF